MRYIITLITCSLLLTQCTAPDIAVQPTGTYDTLGVQWMTIERDNIMYYFQGTGVKGASIFTDMHEDAYEQLAPVFNAQLPRKLRFFVWTDWEVAEQRLNHFPGFALQDDCICHIRASQTLGHEMTHILAYWADGIPPTTQTRFIAEGVAVAFDLSDGNKKIEAQSVLAGRNVSSVTEFWSGSLKSAPEDLFYPVAGAFVEFLYKKNMHDKFFALLRNQTIEDAEKIYGKEQLDGLIAEFDSLMGL